MISPVAAQPSTCSEQAKNETNSLPFPSPHPSPLSHDGLLLWDSPSLPLKNVLHKHTESVISPSSVSAPPADLHRLSSHSSPESASQAYNNVNVSDSTIAISIHDLLTNAELPTPVDPTEVDYQSLPSRPEMAFFSYDPGFGEAVCGAYELSRLEDRWRSGMYGEEIAETTKRGFTPSPVRRKYWEDMEEARQRMELCLSETEDEEDGEVIGLHDAKLPTPVDSTKVDYQSLPSRPEMAFFSYDPGFGEAVCLAYELSRVRNIWRRGKYGEEIAETYKRGFTPSPVRRKYWEDAEEALRHAELCLSETEDEEDGEVIGLHDAKNDLSDPETRTNNALDDLDSGNVTTPLSPVHPQPDGGVLGKEKVLLADPDELHAGDRGRKRQRDSVDRSEDMDGQVERERSTKRRKPP